MGRVIINENPDPERQAFERAKAFNSLTDAEKLSRLFALIDLTMKLNGGKPVKLPQGKGIVIRKPKK